MPSGRRATSPVPSPADVGYLGVYPLAFAGLTLLVKERSGLQSSTVWIDGLIAALVVGALGAAVVFEAVLKTVGGRPISIATNLAYPLGDMLLLSLVVAMVALQSWRPDRRSVLLGAGIVCFWAADSMYLVESAQASSGQDSLFNIIGWAGFLLVAIAAWSPSPARAPREATATIWTPISFAIVGLGLLVYATARSVDPLAVALSTAALLGVMLRLVITFRENVAMLNASRREARTDALTGIRNRRQMMLDLEHRFELEPGEAPWHLLILDLDGFKAFNDRFGHPAGDALLARLGGRLAAALGEDGDAYRMGGDEFAALLECSVERLGELTRDASTALSETGHEYRSNHRWAPCPCHWKPARQATLCERPMYASTKTSRGDANCGPSSWKTRFPRRPIVTAAKCARAAAAERSPASSHHPQDRPVAGSLGRLPLGVGLVRGRRFARPGTERLEFVGNRGSTALLAVVGLRSEMLCWFILKIRTNRKRIRATMINTRITIEHPPPRRPPVRPGLRA